MTTDTNNDFERKIKSSLEGFEAPYATGDWEDMDSRLNTLPKQNNTFNLENLKSLKFKWNFSMNIYIALIACAGFFLLMYKLGGVSGTSSVVAPPTPMNTIPVTNTTDIRTPSNGVAPQSDRNSDSPEANSGLSSRTTPIDSIPNRVYAPVEVPHQTVPVEASKDKSIAPADPIAGPPVTTEKLKGVVFGDMIDPKRPR
jgi:hypothetical protein